MSLLQQPGSPRPMIPVPAESPRPSDSEPEAAEELCLPAEGAGEEEEMEYRPVVKYVGIGVLLALLLGIEYATYEGGYARGYSDATHSDTVESSINEAAVENLRHFMQVASADDETLLASIAAHGHELAWIREPSVRREAEWMLAQAALERGRGGEISGLLTELFREAPQTDIWARRALATARYLASSADATAALAAYRHAVARLKTMGNQEMRLVAMNEKAALLATTPDEGKLAALDALQQEVASLGEAGRLLRADILGYMGRLYREQGDQQAAMSCFEKALAGVKPDEVPTLAKASVCYGLALLDTGDATRAEALLREGVSRLGDSPADVSYLVSGLRALAQLESARGADEAALAHLYRAEGAATNRIPAQNSFWGCLYDQRGWINLRRGTHDAALADFLRALELSAADDARLQALEGAGECCILLGDAARAIDYLTQAADMRTRLMAHDVSALAHIYSRRALAHDMRGDSSAAAADYMRCAELLDSSTQPADGEKRISSLMASGYALGQLARWAEAAALWELVQPLVAEDANRASEVREQLNLCRRHAGSSTVVEGTEEEDEAAEAPAPRPRRRARR